MKPGENTEEEETFSVKSVQIGRASTVESFGFTLRYVVVYPPETQSRQDFDPDMMSACDLEEKLGIERKEPILRPHFAAPVQTTLVSNVHPKGPAFVSGLKNGDRILSIDGIAISGRPYEEIVRLVQQSGLQLDMMVLSDTCTNGPEKLELSNSAGKIGSLSDDLSEPNGNRTDGLITPDSPSLGSSSPGSLDAGHRCLSDQLYDTPESNANSSQSQRINALLDEMRPHQIIHYPYGAPASPLVSGPSPILRSCYSYDNVAAVHPRQSDNVKSLSQSPGFPPVLIVSSDDLRLQQSSSPMYSGRWNHFQQSPSPKCRPLVKIVPPGPGYSLLNHHGNPALPEIKEYSPMSPRFNQQPLITGQVSKLVQKVTHDSTSPSTRSVRSASSDYEHLSKLRRVSNLSQQFEQGSPRYSVGPVKLYYASVYKRELERLSNSPQGPTHKVLEKAREFEQSGSVSQANSPTGSVSFRPQKSPVSPGKRFALSDWSPYIKDKDVKSGDEPNSKFKRRSPSFTTAIAAEKPPHQEFGSSTQSSGQHQVPDDGRKCLSFNSASTDGRGFEQETKSLGADQHITPTVVQNGHVRNENSTKQIAVSCNSLDSCKPNVQMSEARLRRPNSYVMATDAALPDPKVNMDNVFPAFSAKQEQDSGVPNKSVVIRRPAPQTQHARIQKFINFFSSAGDKVDKESLVGRMQLKKYVPEEQSRVKMLKISSSNVIRQGLLVHQQVPLGKTSGPDRAWRQYWALLINGSLFLSKVQPEQQSDSILAIPVDSLSLNIRSCIVDIAYDGTSSASQRRQFVFRVTTQQHTEHLLQAESADDMLRWIDGLQRNAKGDDKKMDENSSMALIIKRYEAKTQAVSPSGSRKKNAGKTETEVATHSSAQYAQSAPTTSRAQESESTPKSGRKWKKVRKSGSCPVQAQKDTTALGLHLVDYPTSGEDDFVPLLLQLCVKVVEAHGIETVGVYRIPGNTAAVNALTASLEQGLEKVDFSDPRWRDVNVVSSLLKAFIRRLSEPLVTDKLYPFFIDASRITNHQQRLRKLRTLVQKLPRHNYETLRYLMFHLRKIVAHSFVNKMEARNLALMFGPSLVRPSGDSMQTMVIHMSDQCKTVESLIIYCDYIFDSTGDTPPPEPANQESNDEQMTTSFSDVTGLLNRVYLAEEDGKDAKENIVKSMLNVRRGSKKGERKSSSNKSGGSIASTSKPTKTVASKTFQRRTQSDKPLVGPGAKVAALQSISSVDESFNGQYEERDIDAEIEARAAKKDSSPESSPAPRSEHEMSESPIPKLENVDVLESSPRRKSSKNELESVVAEMRRQREIDIYSARRVFIAGANADNIASADSESDTNVDVLVRHTRHLNLSGPSGQALDVLSPETREKIRRLQHEGQLRQLRLKEQQQNLQLTKVKSERARVEQAYFRVRQEIEHEDLLDDPVDALSTTSDYSTTSSAAGGVLAGSAGSCNGSLPPASMNKNRSISSMVSSDCSPQPTRTYKSGTGSLRDRPWYELEESSLADTPLSSSGHTLSSTDEPAVTLDQNRNLAAKSDTAASADVRTLTSNEKPRSRISQKIKFRSSSQKEPKRRRDPRRHTLSDFEQIKELFRGTESKQKAPKAAKFKSWLKWSFRKSSPDLSQLNRPTANPTIDRT